MVRGPVANMGIAMHFLTVLCWYIVGAGLIWSFWKMFYIEMYKEGRRYPKMPSARVWVFVILAGLGMFLYFRYLAW